MTSDAARKNEIITPNDTLDGPLVVRDRVEILRTQFKGGKGKVVRILFPGEYVEGIRPSTHT
jgi:hypothetical protein